MIEKLQSALIEARRVRLAPWAPSPCGLAAAAASVLPPRRPASHSDSVATRLGCSQAPPVDGQLAVPPPPAPARTPALLADTGSPLTPAVASTGQAGSTPGMLAERPEVVAKLLAAWKPPTLRYCYFPGAQARRSPRSRRSVLETDEHTTGSVDQPCAPA